MGLLDKLKKQTKAKETEQEVEKKEQQPGGAVFIPRSLNEIFADNRKYICQDKVDPVKIRRQFVKEGNRFAVTVGKVSENISGAQGGISLSREAGARTYGQRVDFV